MVTVLEELGTDKSMDRIIASMKQIPLSASTVAHRVHILAEDVQRLVIDGIKLANTDISQLCVFVRYFGKDF